MQDALPINVPPPPKRRTGPARAAVEATLKAWRSAGHLTEAAHAATRRVLRDSADAVDAAHLALEPPRCQSCGARVRDAVTASPGTLSFANNIHAQLLASLSPSAVAGPDPYADGTSDDDLAAAVAAALQGGAPDTAPGDAADVDRD